jgi:hypothetical protein
MSSSTIALVIIALAVLVLVNLALRSALRTSRAMHWAWKRSQPPRLGAAPDRLREAFQRRCAGALAYYVDRPLRILPFEGGGDGVDAAAVSSALSAAMAHVGSLRDSGVDVVTAPVAAGSAIDAVAEAIQGTPSGGQSAATVLRLLGVLLARGELNLSGRVLSSHWRGPGLALSLGPAKGPVLARETLWASDFESIVGADDGFDGEADTDRLMRLATVGAVWVHFTVLSEVWRLDEQECSELLLTASWRSYALVRLGVEAEAHCGESVTRALYALAVDADPANLLAQFDLASLEVRDSSLPDVHEAGQALLERVRDKLAARGESWRSAGRPQVARGRELAWLLDRDPLCYQVAYKEAAAKLNDEIASEAEAGVPARRSWPRRMRGFGKVTEQDMLLLESDLLALERTLQALHGEAGEWPMAGSREWRDLRNLLSTIEGPMLAMWAMIALRTARDGRKWSKQELSEPLPGDPPGWRGALIDAAAGQRLTPGEAIAMACSEQVWRTTRARFSLACWYADTDEVNHAMRELALSLECGGLAARRGLDDPQLRQLRDRRPYEWQVLEARYAGSARQASENGRPAGAAAPAGAVRP